MSDDALRWLFSLEALGMKFGLENVTVLLDQLDNPHQHFASLHIAGTNGKGSVTAMAETALRRAGYRTARYTSPHLERIEERFVIQGAEVATPDLLDALSAVRSAVQALLTRGVLTAPPTFFECTTAAAFELFRRARVEIAVLEVGLGGRLDATNVVTPVAAAITTIDFDHQVQLGSTIQEIALEKAGIIKRGVPLVIGCLPSAAEVVVEDRAAELGAPLTRACSPAARPIGRPRLPGLHQLENAQVMTMLLRVLNGRGFSVPDEAIAYGIEHVEWPGRLELFLHQGAEVLLDAAHNPAGARALSTYLQDAGWITPTLIFAVMADKDIGGILAPLLPRIGTVICTTAPTARAAAADDLARCVREMAPGVDVRSIENPAEALAHACAASPRVVAAGSMFLIGPLRGILR
ncbi:MAG: bifunctional folylpolyglutamate synthase/dihydrofolate synthase [Acidobacteria bacterium]|nr:bifunctional folylpolyglutamate synthase/dihydrofolate synthase [Acidobacteriota bacterium]